MRHAIIAGTACFAMIFTCGILLGVARTLWIAPRIGATAGVLAELPVILVAGWYACRLCLRRWPVPATAPARSVMGAVAFTLLMAAEFGLVRALGLPAGAYAASLVTPPGLLGLLGQIAFALFPLLQRRSGSGETGV